MSKRVGHAKALKRDPAGPYARGYRAPPGAKPPFSPAPDSRWAKREWQAGQAAKKPRRKR